MMFLLHPSAVCALREPLRARRAAAAFKAGELLKERAALERVDLRLVVLFTVVLRTVFLVVLFLEAAFLAFLRVDFRAVVFLAVERLADFLEEAVFALRFFVDRALLRFAGIGSSYFVFSAIMPTGSIGQKLERL